MCIDGIKAKLKVRSMQRNRMLQYNIMICSLPQLVIIKKLVHNVRNKSREYLEISLTMSLYDVHWLNYWEKYLPTMHCDIYDVVSSVKIDFVISNE